MQALVIPNLDKQNAVSSTRAVLERLCASGIGALLDERLRAPIGEAGGGRFMPFREAAKACDLILSIGGDGTMLHAARDAVAWDKPLLGVNLGRLGFMTSLELSELQRLDALAAGNWREERRMLLECLHWPGDGNAPSRYLALNDVVATKGALSRMVDLDVSCDGGRPMHIRADGVILSTPTGSTAYALSAGGPMVEPGMRCISMTPICPHSLQMRTVIFGPERLITLRPGQEARSEIYLTVDGEQGARLEEGARLEIRRSSRELRLIALREAGFYEILSDKFKLHWLEGGASERIGD
ncbi:MAG: NAD(+)/NADH kinase [Oscillospiraceae bacterium]|nr:NAD(+)/NADH kinase [Oscillospiraceae bacterium]